MITDVTCRVRPSPQERLYEGWIAPDFAAGAEIIRGLAQHHEAPDVLRLSDEEETRVSLDLSQADGVQKSALDAYLSLRRRRGGCLIICGYEGERESVHRRRARLLQAAAGRAEPSRSASAAGRLVAEGALRGSLPARRAARAGRLRRDARDRPHLEPPGRALSRRRRTHCEGALGQRSIVMCHISHAYEDGASLYFTFFASARTGAEIEQWREAKTAACEAIVAAEGTITHHHAVGRDHAPYMAAENGELGLDALRAVKERLDPAGIMNPGKLLP